MILKQNSTYKVKIFFFKKKNLHRQKWKKNANLEGQIKYLSLNNLLVNFGVAFINGIN